MSKTTITLSLEDELIYKIKNIAKETNDSTSKIFEKILLTGLKAGEPIEIKCIICNHIYSSKNGFCSNCDKIQRERDSEINRETNLNNARTRLEKLLDWKSKGAFVSDRELETMIKKVKELENNG